MNGSSVLGILGLLFVSAAVAGPSGAVPVTVGSLPAGCVLDGSHSLPPGLEATPAPLLPVYPNHPGWPVSVPGGISPPVCADLDPAYPGLEVAMGTLSSGTNLYVFHADGTPVSGFPIDIGFFVASSPSIGDLDGDGGLEIVAGDFGSNQVWAVDAHGVALPGWPVAVRANVRSTAALADLDPAFPGLEIVIGVQD